MFRGSDMTTFFNSLELMRGVASLAFCPPSLNGSVTEQREDRLE